MSSIGNKEILAKNLKRYIAISGKERKELADAWGVAYSTLSEWLSAKKYPRIDKIEVMANYFGIQMADLIEEKEKSVIDDGLTDGQRALIDFARSLPEDKAALALRLLQSIVEGD